VFKRVDKVSWQLRLLVVTGIGWGRIVSSRGRRIGSVRDGGTLRNMLCEAFGGKRSHFAQGRLSFLYLLQKSRISLLRIPP